MLLLYASVWLFGLLWDVGGLEVKKVNLDGCFAVCSESIEDEDDGVVKEVVVDGFEFEFGSN